MKKINTIISSSIAPKDTNALWINPEDRTINIFNNGWITLCENAKSSEEASVELTEPKVTEPEETTQE